MTDDDTPGERPAPDLRKAEPAPATFGDTPAESIWQPLDGSAPAPRIQSPTSAPSSPWARPGQAAPPAPQVVAAYSAASAVPGAPSGVFTLAGWWARVGAFLIDSILIGTVALCLTVPVGLATGLTVEETIRFFGMASGAPDSVANPAVLYAALVAQRLIIGAVLALFLARWNGQTPGKRALGLRVMRADGGAMTLRHAMKRELIGRTIIVDSLTFLTIGIAGLVNYLWPLWDQQRRAGHDHFADTRVVSAERR